MIGAQSCRVFEDDLEIIANCSQIDSEDFQLPQDLREDINVGVPTYINCCAEYVGDI